jgi:UDP-N-acetylglucosamine 2-epimerase (non-hydrolysing)
VAVLVGTRPEAIKLAPVVRELRNRPAEFQTRLIATGQHRELAREALAAFGLVPDEDLDVMRPGQDLNSLLSRLMDRLGATLASQPRPDYVLIQGDTTTVLAGALAAFHLGIPVGHVVAGLRTGDLTAPFPEEANRRLAAVVTHTHFCATEQARQNLLREGYSPDRLLVTGNTGIDALLSMASEATDADLPPALAELLGDAQPLVLVTAHRRESFGPGLARLAATLRDLAQQHPDWQFVYPVHPNPQVVGPMRQMLGGLSGFHLIEPVGYRALVRLLARCRFVITDSGGIQEEAPALGKPVLVTREVTERPEAITAGGAMLVGTDGERLHRAASELMTLGPMYDRMAQPRFPYGDGRASVRIADALAARPER